MRVAFYSPLPPERSGIADYSYELLEELRHHVELVAVVADRQLATARVPEGIDLVGSSAADDLVVDVNCYQMGNNSKYHRFFYGRAFDEPGLLVLHDPSLADFTAEMCGGAEGAIFRAEVTYDRPDIGPDDDLPLVDVGNGRKDLDRIEVLLARRITQSNVRTLVHSSAMAREMRRRYPTSDIRTIQLPAPVLPEPAREQVRPDDEFVFGVFGGINYYKRVRPLVDAFVDVRRNHPAARMVIAGRADEPLLERELRAIAAWPELDGSLAIHTDLSLADLEYEMLHCDIGISLRWPTAGEMSATLMRTFGAGRAAIVSDVLQFREIDAAYCWRVTTDFDHEHAALVEVMERAVTDRDACRWAGDAARTFVGREATYEVVARHYVEHLEHCARFHMAKRTSRARYSLRASRPSGVNVIAPVGTREVAEAARRVTGALRASGVDVVVLDLPPTASGPLAAPSTHSLEPGGRRDRPWYGEGSIARWQDDDDPGTVERALDALDPQDWPLVAKGPYPVDLYFTEIGDADRLGRLARVRRHRGRRIVPVVSPGVAPLTTGHRLLLELAASVLTPSAHAAEIARMSTAQPVTVVPWPVRIPGAAHEFGPDAPADDDDICTFLTVVEEGSSVARADPWSVIAAYRLAFTRPERRGRTRLVVVLADAPRRAGARERLAEEVGDVFGTLVLDPDPSALRGLVSSCDVFVSLHRGEGFGLLLADAMALGKPVVCTGYSGNLDYMDETCACLVGYEMRVQTSSDLDLDPGWQEGHEPGRLWSVADRAGAARWMRRFADEPDLRTRIGAAGAANVADRLGVRRVGHELRNFLSSLSEESTPADHPVATGRSDRPA